MKCSVCKREVLDLNKFKLDVSLNFQNLIEEEEHICFYCCKELQGMVRRFLHNLKKKKSSLECKPTKYRYIYEK